MSKYCKICHNKDCPNHGRDITFCGDGFKCNYIPVTTNADRIRAQNDHELAETFAHLICDINEGVEYSDNPNAWLEWLQQPAVNNVRCMEKRVNE